MPRKRTFSVPCCGENKGSTWSVKLAGDVERLRIRFPAAPFSLLSADQAQMLQQNFHTDQNQNDAAGQGRLVLILRAELMPDAYACRGKHKGRAADQRDGSYDPHLQESERNADRQRVDTGRDREDEKLFDIQLLPVGSAVRRVLFFSDNLPDHPAADKSQQSECDPVVKACNIGFKLPAEQPTQKRHQGLKSSKEQGNDQSLRLI